MMENLNKSVTDYEKIKASHFSDEEWESKLFQIKHLLQMIGKRDESIRQYQDFAQKNGFSERELALQINNNLELRAGFVGQLAMLFADFNVHIQPVSIEKIDIETMDILMPQAA
jgi:hypothetical protein